MALVSIDRFMSNKHQNKKDLSTRLDFSSNKPLLGIFLDQEVSEKEENLIKDLIAALKWIDIEVIVLADTNLEALSSPKTIILPYSRPNRKSLLEAADMAICFHFNDAEEMILNGVIPISGKRKEVSNYNPTSETGNGFVYENENVWGIFAAVVRALETFKFPYDWKHIVRVGLGSMKETTVSVEE